MITMNFVSSRRLLAPLLLAASLGTGCSGAPGGGKVAVLDVAAVAKATGQDVVLNSQAEAARKQLEDQLTQIAADLEKQLQAEQSKRGGAAAAAKEQSFQQLAAQARQQYAQTQLLAQQKNQEYQLALANQYRQSVQPVAEKIARARGASVILVAGPTIMWFEPALDITAEVIGEMRANPPPAGDEAKGSASGEAAGNAAE
jgi:Skp family chaperone for outer membrane proteins